MKVIEIANIRRSRNCNKPRLYTRQEIERLKKRLVISVTITTTTVIITAIYTIGTISNTSKLLDAYDTKSLTADQYAEQLQLTKLELADLEKKYSQLESRYEMVSDSLDTTSNIISSLYNDLESANNYINNSISAPSSKQYNPDSDLGNTDIITAERMDHIIDYWIDRNQAYDSPFINQGQVFIKASQLSGLDPIFIFAIASHESDFGRTRIARDKHNYMGIGAYDATPYISAYNMAEDFEAGIISNACWVADKYYNEGQTTLNSMIYGGKCYSTSKDKWIFGISSIMAKSGTIN